MWQAFFERNKWIFGYGLTYVSLSNLDQRKLEQAVVGHDVSGKGKRADALMKTRGAIEALCFVEIKAHTTLLLQNAPYRPGCWAPSDDLAGGVALLRTSVIANAITAIGRTFDRPSSEMVSARDQRDWVCRWILVASYLNEAVIILNKRHDGIAWKLAKIGISNGVTLPPSMPLDTLKSLMAADSTFIKTCDHIRDKFAFHADKEPVMDWLKGRQPLEGVGLMAQFGPHVEDIVFDAAAFAVFEATEKLLIDGFDKSIADVVFAMPHLVEAMVRGLIVSKTLTVEIGEKDGENIVFAYEPGTKF